MAYDYASGLYNSPNNRQNPVLGMTIYGALFVYNLYNFHKDFAIVNRKKFKIINK
jgi:hypothetical protein